jgi:alpha-amylase
MAYLRKNGNHEVLVLLNLSKQVVRCTVTDQHLSGKFKNVFNKTTEDFTQQKDFDMQPWEYLVYEK